ncbi:MAG TPA: Mut7-C RNAse domain-containing protein [Noviherbaspirillum sp.]|uniref:Mut7-C RNAse domain-containing protein n=1 Tax=Noviherbaspirillum sp. TaxID=1926288 RepID=UPI002B497F62|nr:Mut7-C RNAse domain-containing protein [Noviherbaspirillum sp.]HJV86349.1 Mut7-C RNAse domain-containing protein [Noviherbaspirillum sp.]
MTQTGSIVAIAHFRFYAELNDFLAPSQRQSDFPYPLSRDASVKHMIEALGVPHTEVELILVDGVSVDFSHRLQDGEHVSVYPCFASIDVTPLMRLRPPVAGPARFVADAHMGQLAKNLRMLGFDVLYRNDYSDAELARLAASEDRIVLTRDRDLLIRKEIVRGCYLHSTASDAQVMEVIARFDLAQSARAFSRCLTCNGELRMVGKEEVGHRVPPHSRQFYDRFFECQECAQVYWEGSHVARMLGTEKNEEGEMENNSPAPNMSKNIPYQP